jgi:hypothetical protein
VGLVALAVLPSASHVLRQCRLVCSDVLSIYFFAPRDDFLWGTVENLPK